MKKVNVRAETVAQHAGYQRHRKLTRLEDQMLAMLNEDQRRELLDLQLRGVMAKVYWDNLAIALAIDPARPREYVLGRMTELCLAEEERPI